MNLKVIILKKKHSKPKQQSLEWERDDGGTRKINNNTLILRECNFISLRNAFRGFKSFVLSARKDIGGGARKWT